MRAIAPVIGAPNGGALLHDPPRYLSGLATPRSGRGSNATLPPLPSVGTVKGWASALLSAEAPLRYLTDERQIPLAVLQVAGVGWDGQLLTFPMFDRSGDLVAFKTREPCRDGQMRNCPGSGRPWPLYPPRDRERPWVLLVAGELDALRGRSAGIPASSVTLGADRWRDEWTEDLADLRVVVCFDNNEQTQARQCVQRLKDAGIDAQRLDLRRLGLRTPKGDLSDYLNGSGSAQALRGALNADHCLRRRKGDRDDRA